ncbi:MAG: EI24 domain-containing protein [SAR324 cluster bacterium]|nr:EI24 domain-containing protein [SAR324 cluster bacterium]
MNTLDSESSKKNGTFVSPFSVMVKAWHAFQNVEKLKTSVWKTFLINYAIFTGVIVLLNGIIYLYALRPLVDTVFGTEDGSIAILGSVLLWATQIVSAAIFAMAALRFSIVLMSLWHENLVSLVIGHFRSLPEHSFSIGAWLKTLRQTAVTGIKEMFVFLLLLFLSLLPGIGLLLVFTAGAFFMGKDITTPYLNVLQEHREPVKELRKSLRGPAFFLGVIQMLLALLPIVGWLLMPLVMIVQITGLTYVLEETRK